MAAIEIYASHFCPYCRWAMALLDKKGVEYDIKNVDADADLRQQMQARAQRHTVPQIFIDDRHIGGYDDLAALDRAGELDPLL